MGYGSVHLPVGSVVKIGDTVGGLTSLGVLKGDSKVSIAFTSKETLGSKGETLQRYITEMKASGTGEMYQLYADNIQKLLDGALALSTVAAAPVAGHNQVVASGDWAFDRFIPFEHQMGSGAKITPTSVTGSVDGALVANTDFAIVKDAAGNWGIAIRDSVTVTSEAQNITIVFDYTPAASKTLKMGDASAELTPKIVQFEKEVDGKYFRVTLWSAVNEKGIDFSFPQSTGDPASIPFEFTGKLDATRAAGEQLVEIYDEIGLTL